MGPRFARIIPKVFCLYDQPHGNTKQEIDANTHLPPIESTIKTGLTLRKARSPPCLQSKGGRSSHRGALQTVFQRQCRARGLLRWGRIPSRIRCTYTSAWWGWDLSNTSWTCRSISFFEIAPTIFMGCPSIGMKRSVGMERTS